MKTQRKNHKAILCKSNSRWKWMVGATAATAAGVTTSQASMVTINLVDNYLGDLAFGQNHLNADLTGDGHPDLTIANVIRQYYHAGVKLNGVYASFQFFGTMGYNGHMRLGARSAFYSYFRTGGQTYRYGTPSLMGSIPIFFKDLHINGGAPTSGLLQVTVSANFPNAEIQLDSFSYNTPGQTLARSSGVTVPDQGSSLALRAMGAGGILAFRRWRTAQGRS
jgi:hypothetical protein